MQPQQIHYNTYFHLMGSRNSVPDDNNSKPSGIVEGAQLIGGGILGSGVGWAIARFLVSKGIVGQTFQILGRVVTTTPAGAVIGLVLDACLMLIIQNSGNTRQAVVADQALFENQLDLQNFQGLKWEPIDISQKQFDELVALKEAQFKDFVQATKCHAGTLQIMKQPCTVKCCKDNKLKDHRWGQQSFLKQSIERSGRCPLCFKNATVQDIEFDCVKHGTIIGFRKYVFKTYQALEQADKGEWKKMIDAEFGIGYTDEQYQLMTVDNVHRKK